MCKTHRIIFPKDTQSHLDTFSIQFLTAKYKNDKTVTITFIQVKKLDYWKIVALIGTVIFLFSGFLPLISDNLFSPSASFSLFNLYTIAAQGITSGEGSTVGTVSMDVGAIGILLTFILYPIAVILGFVSIAKRKVAMAAGILGLLCWVGAMIALSSLNAMQYAGLGVYIGIAGAIIIAIAYFMKPSPAPAPQAAYPPPPQQYAPSR
jgi:hypothetical protein